MQDQPIKFRAEELVKFQGKEYPVVGGRLRLAHENGFNGLETAIVEYRSREAATVQATVTIKGATYQGFGTADAKRDGRLAETLLELAETRAIARALRFAGFGVEFTGAEEVSHVPRTAANPARPTNPRAAPVAHPSEEAKTLKRTATMLAIELPSEDDYESTEAWIEAARRTIKGSK